MRLWDHKLDKGRTWTAIGIVLLIGVLLLSGCGSQSPETPQSSGLTGSIQTTGVQVDPQQIIFTGRTTLPEGACIQTQLAIDGEPASWWPVETCADRQEGEWQITVAFAEAGAPDTLDDSAQYVLRAWASTDPTIKAEPFYFDLIGPQS
jgi:hypothetical protein